RNRVFPGGIPWDFFAPGRSSTAIFRPRPAIRAGYGSRKMAEIRKNRMISAKIAGTRLWHVRRIRDAVHSAARRRDMKREVVKTARIGAGLLLAFALAGCLTDPVAGPGGDRPARVTFEVVSDAAGQAGGIVPDVNRLVIVMTSSTRDTLRDTVTAAGSR